MTAVRLIRKLDRHLRPPVPRVFTGETFGLEITDPGPRPINTVTVLRRRMELHASDTLRRLEAPPTRLEFIGTTAEGSALVEELRHVGAVAVLHGPAPRDEPTRP